jgi:hypothetical protein
MISPSFSDQRRQLKAHICLSALRSTSGEKKAHCSALKVDELTVHRCALPNIIGRTHDIFVMIILGYQLVKMNVGGQDSNG